MKDKFEQYGRRMYLWKGLRAMSESELTQKALSICKPPFEFKHGYIFDSDGHIIADHPMDEGVLLIRGWGRIQHMDNPEQLQDEIGRLIALAMTEFWEKMERIE